MRARGRLAFVDQVGKLCSDIRGGNKQINGAEVAEFDVFRGRSAFREASLLDVIARVGNKLVPVEATTDVPRTGAGKFRMVMLGRTDRSATVSGKT